MVQNTQLAYAKKILAIANFLKSNIFWICLVLICWLAMSSDYCVQLSWVEGFTFKKCS